MLAGAVLVLLALIVRLIRGRGISRELRFRFKAQGSGFRFTVEVQESLQIQSSKI